MESGITSFALVKDRKVYHLFFSASYGVRGNARALWDFYEEVKKLLFTWLNRRSQRRSYTWKAFTQMLKNIRLVRPRITEKTRLHRVAC